jgi:hypothetical protein
MDKINPGGQLKKEQFSNVNYTRKKDLVMMIYTAA